MVFCPTKEPVVDVEIWSDIACPWYYIGKRRFEAALEQFEHRDDVNVTWRSFELDPDAPHERTGDRAERLVHLAESHDLQDAMKERLLRAYFTEGELMSDHDTLVRLAGEVGLDEQEVRELLDGDRYADEVRADERTAGELGISAVPTFVLDRRLGASGAQPPDALLDLLRQGWAKRSPASAIA